jgi:hypothetical protein
VDGAGNLYLAGSLAGSATIGSTAVPNLGDLDMYLAKYSPQGTVQWVQSAGGSGEDRWGNLALDAAGAPYLVGTFNATAQFGPFTLSSTGGADVVVAAYSAQGAPRWVQQAGGPGPDADAALGLDGAGNIYTLGTFNLTATFAPLAVSTFAPSIFIARLGNAPLATRTGRALALGVFPAPAHDAVHLAGLPVGTRVQLLDALGRVARETTVSAVAEVSVRGLAPGLYTLRATDAQGQHYAGRVAVE